MVQKKHLFVGFFLFNLMSKNAIVNLKNVSIGLNLNCKAHKKKKNSKFYQKLKHCQNQNFLQKSNCWLKFHSFTQKIRKNIQAKKL